MSEQNVPHLLQPVPVSCGLAFPRSNPFHDICGVEEKTQFKHWGCRRPLMIGDRIKPFHVPALAAGPDMAARVRGLIGGRGKSLYGSL